MVRCVRESSLPFSAVTLSSEDLDQLGDQSRSLRLGLKLIMDLDETINQDLSLSSLTGCYDLLIDFILMRS